MASSRKNNGDMTQLIPQPKEAQSVCGSWPKAGGCEEVATVRSTHLVCTTADVRTSFLIRCTRDCTGTDWTAFSFCHHSDTCCVGVEPIKVVEDLQKLNCGAQEEKQTHAQQAIMH